MDSKPSSENLASGRLLCNCHELMARVYYEDTDFSGVVYHANYLRYMERGRSDMMRLLGINHVTMEKQGIFYAVHQVSIKFYRSTQIDDLLKVNTMIKRAFGARFTMYHEIICNNCLVTAADVEIALINKKGNPVRIPEYMLKIVSPFIEAAKNT